MQINELKQELKDGIKRPLYIFTGVEREVMFKYLDRINTRRVMLPNFSSIKQYISSANLFHLPMLLVIENDTEASQMSLQEILKLNRGHNIVLIYDSIDERRKLFKEAKKDIVDFGKYDTNFLINYIKSYIELNTALAKKVVERSGHSVARLEQEIDKLKSYDGELTEEVIEALIPEEPENKLFQFIDLIMVRGDGAFKMYDELVKLGESQVKLLSILHTKARQTFLVKPYATLQNAEVAGKTGLTFFQVQKAKEVMNYWTMEGLYKLMRDCQELEVMMKNGEIPTRIGFEALLIKIFTK